ncbi:hypothetical protein MTP03_22160 [Tsukamurella sp. PLM1]|nr:hypothetical protein MTP03_22160 [Tsukamurella sp. PLM1]
MYRTPHAVHLQQVVRIVDEFGEALYLRERVRGLLQVHAHADPRILRQEFAFRRVTTGGEDDAAVVDHEPDRRGERSPVAAEVREVPRARSGGEELDHGGFEAL